MKHFILNLDPGFCPLRGDTVSVSFFTFSGGEPHIRIETELDASHTVDVTTRITSFNDVGVLCLAADALRRLHVSLDTLVIPYFPAARQDRIMSYGEPLSVKVYADIINMLGFKKVIVFDPHSDVTPALINGIRVVDNHKFIEKVIRYIGTSVHLVSPDGGALKKIYQLSESLNGLPVIECSKHRNVVSGKLQGFKIYDESFNGQDILIVDDICDGGATFLGIGEVLRNYNIGSMYLAVSHGIFSKGLDVLGDMFERIYTTNSFREVQHPKVIQIPLDETMLYLN